MAAIAVGALAAFAIYSYVGGLEDQADEDARTVEAIRVVSPIARSTPGVDARAVPAFEAVEIPQDIVTGQEIDQTELDAGLIDAKIAANNLLVGQILYEGMFVDPLTSRVTGADRVPDNNVAITISVDSVHGVAGLIVPGDFVNMMSIRPDACGTDATEDTGDTGAEGATPRPAGLPNYGILDPPNAVPGSDVVFGVCTAATMIYQEVQVLFVDRSPIPLAGETTTDPAVAADGSAATVVDTGLITLAVPNDAAMLIASIPADSWYLTLLPRNYTPGQVPDFDPIFELVPGENPEKLTPYGPAGFQNEGQ